MDNQNQTWKSAVKIVNANRVLKANIPIEPFRNNNNTEKPRKHVELIGRSWAADSTAFVVPALDLALDAGYPVHGKRSSAVLVTHTHTDHIHSITHLKSRSKPPNIYLPTNSVQNVQLFLDFAQQMTSDITTEEYQSIEWEPSFYLNGVRPGDKFYINKKRGILARAIQCDHSINCVGYIVYQEKSNLKPDYVGLPGPEIGKLRKSGVQVTFSEEQPLFCFLGDTHASILSGPDADLIFSCPTVIIECSFLTDDCLENAERTKHVVWSQLKAHVVAHPETFFVLTHFSHRWSSSEIVEFFRQENLPNILPWVPAEEELYCRSVGEQVEAIDEVWSHF